MEKFSISSDASIETDEDDFDEVPDKSPNSIGNNLQENGVFSSNGEESDNTSTVSMSYSNLEVDSKHLKHRTRNLSLRSEDSERSDYSKDDEAYQRPNLSTPLVSFYNSSDGARLKSVSLSERESESCDDDNDNYFSASASDSETKSRKTSFNDNALSETGDFSCSKTQSMHSYSSYYGATLDDAADSKETEKLSTTFRNSSKKFSKPAKFDVCDDDVETNHYIPKNRFRSKTHNESSSNQGSSSAESRKRFESADLSDDSPPPKKSKCNPLMKNKVISNIMAKMDFIPGRGLGKHSQGAVEPVALSTQSGRRGLGMVLEGLEREDVDWNFDREVLPEMEEVHWLEYEDSEILELRPTLVSWMKRGESKLTLDGETHFCDADIVEKLLNKKTVFDKLDDSEMRPARDRSNPFELIRKAIFLNRAALKMANMDRRFDFMFTQPVDPNNEPMVKENELLYFADVCAGPGGFSEYVLWRKGWRAKGFGMTLKEMNDFKLADFYAGPCESFEPHYGPDGDGNVYSGDNIISFKETILSQTQNQGVHFMMSDGGFSVRGKENIQEILSKQLYLCQCLVALHVVRENGHFVTKLFDLFTPFSVGLIYLMYRCFRKICIFKPNSSRPANSERYLICKWRREESVIKNIRLYLFDLNKCLNRIKLSSQILEKKRFVKEEAESSEENNQNSSNEDDEEYENRCRRMKSQEVKQEDIVQLVPVDVMKSDDKFYKYLRKSNKELALRQIIYLKKVVAFVKNPNLIEGRQKELKEKCLKYWGIPDEARSAPKPPTPSLETIRSIFDNDMKVPPPTEILSNGRWEDLSGTLKGIYNWKCVPIQDSEKATLFFGQGRKRIQEWKGDKWYEISSELMLELSPNTILYGEPVFELRGEGRGSMKSSAFHIIDAYKLGGELIGDKPFKERTALCQLFCKAVSKRECPIKMKSTVNFSELHHFSNFGLVSKQMKNLSNHRLCASIPPFHYEVSSILFISQFDVSLISREWSSHLKRYYNYDLKKREGLPGDDSSFLSSFSKMMQTRKLWSWRNFNDFRPPVELVQEVEKFVAVRRKHAMN